MFNWTLTVVISSVPILLSSRELLEIPYFMAPVFSSFRSVALVSPLLTTLAAARRQYPCRCKYYSNPSCFHIIPFLSDLYPCEGLAFLLQSGSSFTISPFRWEQGSTEDTLFFYISACKIFFGVNQLLQISDLPVDSVLLPKKPLQRAVHDFKPIDITVIQKRPDLSDTNPRSAIFNDTIQALEPFAIVELELLRLRSLIRHKKPNPVIIKKRFPGNVCYPADFPRRNIAFRYDFC